MRRPSAVTVGNLALATRTCSSPTASVRLRNKVGAPFTVRTKVRPVFPTHCGIMSERPFVTRLRAPPARSYDHSPSSADATRRLPSGARAAPSIQFCGGAMVLADAPIHREPGQPAFHRLLGAEKDERAVARERRFGPASDEERLAGHCPGRRGERHRPEPRVRRRTGEDEMSRRRVLRVVDVARFEHGRQRCRPRGPPAR